MTIKSILCFSVVTLLALPASAGDFLQGTYVGFTGGLVPNAKEDVSAPGLKSSFKRKLGFNASLNAGKRVHEHVRVQADIGYLRSGLDKIGGEKVKKGSFSAVHVSASVYFDYSLSESFTPFVGIGAGLASFDLGKVTFDDAHFGYPTEKFDVQDSVTPFLKLNAGAAYKLMDNLSVVGEYNFMQSADFEFRQKNAPAGNPDITTSFQSHIAQVGLRYNF
ncbi:outer membrane protein [Pseudovibrio sp. FO-BEG1]|uniref:outer membrane protein n=1 Tax=Pseudovibrio sp. (strain FO-BEG1) TaxID=911045 RepID=UPI0002F8A3A7|nr:outer membrane beta-barrel protein [Pseudovibrio sp. FO-BEG1]